MTSAQPPTRMGMAHLYAIALLIAYVALIAVHPLPPMLGDFSDWIYEGALLARHMRGLPDAAHVLKHYPVPNTTETLALGLLMLVFSWATAAKIFLFGQLAVTWLGIRSLARAAGSPASIWWVAPGAFFVNVNFWYGFADFSLGVAFLLFFTAALLRYRDGREHEWPLAGWMLLLFFTHMVPFTFACLLLLGFCAQMRAPRTLRALVLPYLLLGWYAWGRFAAGNRDSAAAPAPGPHWGAPGFWAYKANTVLKSFGLVNPIAANAHSAALALFGSTVFLLAIAVAALLCCLILVLLWHSAGTRWPDTFVWAAVGLSIAAYLVLPASLLGLSDPGSRVLQTAMYTALFFCMRETRAEARLWKAAAVCGVLLSACGLVLFARVAWADAPPAAAHAEMPAAMEQLAGAHYVHAERYLRDLQHGDFGEAVFPTGMFRNQSR